MDSYLETTTLNDYQTQAARTADRCSLLHAALGLTGEAGEFAELIKKFHYHGHSLDATKAIKELGDILWYVAYAATTLNVTLDDVAQRNLDKLRARYPDGFSAKASINRKPEDV